jgi:class 3 adenylate cyclase/tetratricopeptide (TPR) repeat protein
MENVRVWLAEHGLAQLHSLFEREQIDWNALQLLSEENVRELGLPLGVRLKLIAALQALHGNGHVGVDGAGASNDDKAFSLDLTIEGERRQVTVMFCDMVGFTALASTVDPEVLQHVVRTYEDACSSCIARFKGYVFQLLGDGVVAFFGYPSAHETDAERAIHAALAINDKLAEIAIPGRSRICVRIGIATGVVVFTGAGRKVVGESMNLAARLQAIAAPGEINVSTSVQRLARTSFEYLDLGDKSLKGFEKPVRVHRVLGVKARGGRFEISASSSLTPLIGREHELAILHERWAQARNGHGQVVLLTGEPGIGKSRIVHTLNEQLSARGVQAIRLHSSPHYINSAFWPNIACLTRAARLTVNETDESRLAKLERLLQGEYSRPANDVGVIATMMSIHCGDRYGTEVMTSHKHKQEVIRALVELTNVAARKGHCVLYFEDLHWADPSSIEVLEHLLERIHDIPLLVVLTSRNEALATWTANRRCTTLALSRLSRMHGAAIVTQLAGGKTLPDVVLEEILARTDGVPLFVEELTRSVLESGSLTESADRYEYDKSASDLKIPPTLRDSLMERLDRHARAKGIAQIGATIGRTFSRALLAAIAHLPAAELEEGLTQLIDSGLAVVIGHPPHIHYSFKHALVQDIAYDSLLKSRRKELHQKIAVAFDEHFPEVRRTHPEVLAHHFTVATVADRAIPLWIAAGEFALKRMALTEAIAHVNQGLKLVTTLADAAQRHPLELSLRRILGAAWMAAKGWPSPQVRDSLYPALPLISPSADRRDVLVIFWGLFSNTLSQGRVSDSLEWAQNLLARGHQQNEDDFLVTAHLMLLVSNFWLGNLSTCLHHADELAAIYDPVRHHHIADEINHDPFTGAGVYRAQVSWMLGFPERAVIECAAKTIHARARAHVFDLSFSLAAGADVYEYRREPEHQYIDVQEAERIGRENGLMVIWKVLAPLRLGTVLIRGGKIAEGIDMLKTALDLREATGGHGGSNPYLKTRLAEAVGLTGDISHALQLIERQIEQIRRPGWGERCHYAEIKRIEGWLHQLRGDSEAAEECYQDSLAWAGHQGALSWQLRTAINLAHLWRSQGKADSARDLIRSIYGQFTEGFDTKDLVDAREFLASSR